MNAMIVPVGDEILIGQIVDTNSAWIAQQLNLQGVNLRHTFAVSDNHEEIIKVLDYATSQADIVLMTGGLGPTKDDITKKAIADFLGDELYFHEETWGYILEFFEKFGRTPHEDHKVQCFMPKSADILRNKAGTAPGMWFNYKGKVIISMPGVPNEMKYLMTNEVLPRLKTAFPGVPIAHRTIMTAGAGETDLSVLLKGFEENLSPDFKLAYLPSYAQVRLRLSASNADEAFLNTMLDEKANEIESLVAEYAFGREEISLEMTIGEILKKQGRIIATAESCTGGRIAARLASVVGASEYYTGSIVAYSYEAKMKQLSVSGDTLQTHGAVSAETVTEMVKGCLDALSADVAIAVSGIAGPGGGTPEKPVGTIWIAVGNKDHIQTHKLSLGRSRDINIEYTTNFALNMARKFLLAQ
jgi:nicotinamide-nucleotide amidase